LGHSWLSLSMTSDRDVVGSGLADVARRRGPPACERCQRRQRGEVGESPRCLWPARISVRVNRGRRSLTPSARRHW